MVGRLAFSPWLGLDIGTSAHLGTYDTRGENLLGIYALDTTWQRGPFELLFEGAYATIETDALADSLGQPSRGLTRRKLPSPKFAMARATMPMFSLTRYELADE